MNENVINIADFYSKDNEENGIWYEVKVRGVGTGIEFKLYGPNSSAASVAQDKLQKAKDEVNKIEDVKAKSTATDKMLSEYAAALVCDIRGKDGKKLLNEDGTEVTMKDVKNILYKSPVIATDIARFESNQNNFLSN
ncbi:MAG: hypothetical protein MJZ37_00610 [Bacilli bacterium]|nr:hypothetical protein [Bacilli bacterium]